MANVNAGGTTEDVEIDALLLVGAFAESRAEIVRAKPTSERAGSRSETARRALIYLMDRSGARALRCAVRAFCPGRKCTAVVVGDQV